MERLNDILAKEQIKSNDATYLIKMAKELYNTIIKHGCFCKQSNINKVKESYLQLQAQANNQ